MIVAALFALGLPGCANLGGPRTLTLSESDLNALIAQHFPKNERLAELADVTVSAPRVWLIPERNRLGTSIEVKGGDRLWGRQLQGRLTMDCALRFEPVDASIRLAQVKVQQFSLDAGGTAVPLPVQRVGGLLAERVLEDLSIYQVKPERMQRLYEAGFRPGAVNVTSNGVEVTLAPR
jgi:hypothetical protein